MEYITEIIKRDDTIYISIIRTSDNNRWLCNPLQQCPVEDDKIKQLFIETFTDEVKDDFKCLLDAIMQEECRALINELEVQLEVTNV